MRVALLRIGIDTGAGGIHGPLFPNGSFEYIPIPDCSHVDNRTYGNVHGRHGRPLVEYFPPGRQAQMVGQSIHFDPEFETFTYGDPTPPKAGLRRLEPGDMLIFYCGLQGWGFESAPALYLMGYFEIAAAGQASDFAPADLRSLFAMNFHVRHSSVFVAQEQRLVLVKGSAKSRLLNRAVLMSAMDKDRSGKPLKVLSADMQEIFGSFGGKLSFQRSPTRWVDAAHVDRAAEFMRSLD
jgi:hypothetical protein